MISPLKRTDRFHPTADAGPWQSGPAAFGTPQRPSGCLKWAQSGRAGVVAAAVRRLMASAIGEVEVIEPDSAFRSFRWRTLGQWLHADTGTIITGTGSAAIQSCNSLTLKTA